MQSPSLRSTLVRHQLGWRFCADCQSGFFVSLAPESAVKYFALNQGQTVVSTNLWVIVVHRTSEVMVSTVIGLEFATDLV
jgi:hypothetical protein